MTLLWLILGGVAVLHACFIASVVVSGSRKSVYRTTGGQR